MNRTAIKNVLLNYYYPIFDALNDKDTTISYYMKNNIDFNKIGSLQGEKNVQKKKC